MINEQELRDIYYDPSEGYQSVEKLYQKAKADGIKVSRRLVKEWLETQDTYTRYNPVIRKHKFQKNLCKKPRRSNTNGPGRYGKIRE